MSKVIPVKVALRCRPLAEKEILEGCACCIEFACDEPQVIIGGHKSFTYDYAFPPHIGQDRVYLEAIAPLVNGIFEGYNATVLAYGQTGSGKTHTMSGSDHSPSEDNHEGVIQKAVYDLFDGVKDRKEYNFSIKVTYLELYNETFRDLLIPMDEQRETIHVREDPRGGIMVTGLTEMIVSNAEETLRYFRLGISQRSTGATAMNQTSSRSHSVFTIYISRTKVDDVDDVCHAKFNLVDLAGSERQKKTHAEGERLKEGININMGLHILGNVIAALSGENGKKSRYVPYRDSKLTRLLQDSLGGNSHTLMVACISPADSNYDETSSTLQYADRARKIKNKPKVNRDPTQAEIFRLRQLLQEKEKQLTMCTCGASTTSTAAFNSDKTSVLSPIMAKRIEQLETERANLLCELSEATEISAALQEKAMKYEAVIEVYQTKLDSLKDRASRSLGTTIKISPDSTSGIGDSDDTKNKTEHSTNANQSFLQNIVREIGELQNLDPDRINENKFSSPENSDDESELVKENNNREGDMTSTAFTLRRAKMNRDIDELSGKLFEKQKLIKEMTNNDNTMTDMIRKLEDEIKRLESELNDAKKQFSEVKKSDLNSKTADLQRKKVKDLEEKLNEMKKKLADKDRLLKMSSKRQADIVKIQNEMIALKRTRVKLMNQMKDETSAFQKKMQMKDKELIQFKAQERKRVAEMVKESKSKDKRMIVLKRKVDEYAAVQKQMNEAIRKKNKATDERNNQLNKAEAGGIGLRTRKYIKREFQLILSIEEAREALQQEITERKELTEELNKLKIKLEAPPSKRQMTKSKSARDSSNTDLREKIQTLNDIITTKNAFIQELQHKISEAEKSGDKKNRWDGIKSIIEAKCAMKWLAETALSSKMELKKFNRLVEDMQRDYEQRTSEIEELKQLHQKEVDDLRRRNEENMLACLQLGTCSTETQTTKDSFHKRLSVHEERLRQLSSAYEELDRIKAENEQLKRQLNGSHKRTATEAMMDETFCLESGSSDVLQQQHNTTFFKSHSPPTVGGGGGVNKNVKPETEQSSSDSNDISVEFSDSEEENSDPTWTPGTKGNIRRPRDGSHEYNKSKENKSRNNSALLSSSSSSSYIEKNIKQQQPLIMDVDDNLYDEKYASPGGLMSGNRTILKQNSYFEPPNI